MRAVDAMTAPWPVHVAARVTRLRVSLLLGAMPALLAAQPRHPWEGGTTRSLGQPGAWHPTLGVGTGVQRRDGARAALAEARAGAYVEVLSRAMGLGGLHAEAYAGSRDTELDGGLRLRALSPLFHVGVGVDLNAADGTVRPVASLLWPGRRGGLFHDGSMVRVDYAPGPQRALVVGVEVPVLRRIPLGSTRPFTDAVPLEARRLASAPPPPLPAGRRAAIDAALGALRREAHVIRQLTVPWLDHQGGGGRASDDAVRRRLAALREVAAANSAGSATRRFHDALDEAFAHAVPPGGADGTDGADRALGRHAADQARAVLLDEVLLPYNRLLGQAKAEDTTRDFALLARGAFLRWLHLESGVPIAQAGQALAVFTALLDVVEENRAAAHREWRGSRFVWLPLQYALRPGQHDSQEELDALVARATGTAFTEGNAVGYIINEQFQYQLHRTIHAARRYHVLWTHDFRGLDAQGDPDEMSYRHVLRSYLAAMTDRVRAYDRTGVFPTYLVILDEWFYEANRGRLWMSLLEDPLHHRVRLPERFRPWEDSLRTAQEALREAIAASPLLTAQRRQFGEAWLRNLVKVHVNITNASDPTFWSWRVATGLPIPDTWMRDHRKLVFYDVTEADPSQGEAIVTGAGVGEHYASLAWEDRSLLLRGPVTLGLKAAARELLLGQGIPPERIPAVLQPLPDTAAVPVPPGEGRAAVGDAAVAADGRPLRAVVLQNRTGFADKHVNVAKAVLYTLAPEGAVLKIPDSLWNGTFWGSALLGGALRGVRVLVIAPAPDNAPARAFGSMIRMRELLWRLAVAAQVLDAQIAAHGGLLKVGLFAAELPVSDIPGKIRAVRTTLEREAWLRDLFAFPPAVYDGLDEMAATLGQLPAAARSGSPFEAPARPLLHLKANYLASREAWTLMSRGDWVRMTREFVPRRMAQLSAPSAAVASFDEIPDAVIDVGRDVVRAWFDSLPPADRERVVFHTLLGSANQNDRSLVGDGEAAVLLSNWPSITAYIDMISLIGQSRWIDRPETLEALFPRRGAIPTRLAHWLKASF